MGADGVALRGVLDAFGSWYVLFDRVALVLSRNFFIAKGYLGAVEQCWEVAGG